MCRNLGAEWTKQTFFCPHRNYNLNISINILNFIFYWYKILYHLGRINLEPTVIIFIILSPMASTKINCCYKNKIFSFTAFPIKWHETNLFIFIMLLK